MHAISLYRAQYNFGHIHQWLRKAPAMEPGMRIPWSLEEVTAFAN